MTRRRGVAGFTLIEVMVALVLTSVVVSLAYATARAGIETRERLERYRADEGGAMVARARLVDALRHLPEGGGLAMNEALFTVEDRIDANGLSADVVRFLTTGVRQPRGASAGWQVTLAPSPEGVRFSATPLAEMDAAPIVALIPRARGLDVRVLGRTGDADWMPAWDEPGRVPAAVDLAFLSEDGSPLGSPLVVQTGLEVAP